MRGITVGGVAAGSEAARDRGRRRGEPEADADGDALYRRLSGASAR
jgi:hypothetical protein